MKKIGMKHSVILLILVFSMTACTGKDGTFDIRKPYSLDLTPPPGPPEYEQGWTDGCESGMSAYANGMYKTMRVFNLRQDPVLRNNRMYYQVWKDAFLYCSLYWETVNTTKL